MHVLIVDDHPAVREALHISLSLADLPVEVAASPAQALRIVRRGQTGVVLHDMNFTPGATSGAEGRELFAELRALDPDLPVLLMTAWADVPSAVELIRLGADDYLEKPWDDASLIRKVRMLLEGRRRAQGRPDASPEVPGMVFESAEMHQVVRLVGRVAPTDLPVLVTGPTGAGKERVAGAVHTLSGRKGRFYEINCAALPPALLEAELFGARKGAYTGADQDRAGAFEAADGGTLFLDEIATLSAAGQAAMLRVLQSQQVRRIGEHRARPVDVRVVAATNADMTQEVADGRFREDLFWRLAAVQVRVPPLRERPDDIAPLLAHFLAEHGRTLDQVDPGALEAARSHAWPGNVRELQHAVHRAVATQAGERIGVADLGLRETSPIGGDEATEIRRSLAEHAGNVSAAAAALGLSRQALYRRMKRLGVRVSKQVER